MTLLAGALAGRSSRTLLGACSFTLALGCGPRVVTGDEADSDACPAVVNCASLVTENNVPADAPTPRGGLLVEGLYHLTAATLWRGAGGPSGPSGRQSQTTLRIVADQYQSVGFDPRAGEFRHAGTIETHDTNWRMTLTCPMRSTSGFQYTATTEGFTLFFTSDGVTGTSVYSLQERP